MQTYLSLSLSHDTSAKPDSSPFCFVSFVFHSGNLFYMGFPVIRQISLLGFQ